jgi:TRAP-type C4-dicarboxylate transport system substrate-binding protein
MLRTDHIYSLYFVAVNDKFFRQLPKDLREAVKTAAKDATRFVNGLIDENKILEKYKAQKCNIVYNETLREQLRDKLATLGPQLEADGFWSKGLYEYAIKVAR